MSLVLRRVVVRLLVLAVSTRTAEAELDYTAVANFYDAHATTKRCGALADAHLAPTAAGTTALRLRLHNWLPSAELSLRLDVAHLRVVDSFFAEPLSISSDHAGDHPGYTSVRLVLSELTPPDRTLILHLAYGGAAVPAPHGLIHSGSPCQIACGGIVCAKSSPSVPPFCGERGLCCSKGDILCGNAGCDTMRCCALAPGLAHLPSIIDCEPVAPSSVHWWAPKTAAAEGLASSPTIAYIATWATVFIIVCACLPLMLEISSAAYEPLHAPRRRRWRCCCPRSKAEADERRASSPSLQLPSRPSEIQPAESLKGEPRDVSHAQGAAPASSAPPSPSFSELVDTRATYRTTRRGLFVEQVPIIHSQNLTLPRSYIVGIEPPAHRDTDDAMSEVTFCSVRLDTAVAASPFDVAMSSAPYRGGAQPLELTPCTTVAPSTRHLDIDDLDDFA